MSNKPVKPLAMIYSLVLFFAVICYWFLLDRSFQKATLLNYGTVEIIFFISTIFLYLAARHFEIKTNNENIQGKAFLQTSFSFPYQIIDRVYLHQTLFMKMLHLQTLIIEITLSKELISLGVVKNNNLFQNVNRILDFPGFFGNMLIVPNLSKKDAWEIIQNITKGNENAKIIDINAGLPFFATMDKVSLLRRVDITFYNNYIYIFNTNLFLFI